MLETSTVRNHCLNCGKTTSEIKETCIRAHMGNHLLQAQCNIPEPVAFEVLGESMPCGFCGLSGQDCCKVTLSTTRSSSWKLSTQCPFQHAIVYNAVRNGSNATPCRNIPIICPLCQPLDKIQGARAYKAFWLYNWSEHAVSKHAEYASPHNPSGIPLPYQTWKHVEILPSEYTAIGLPVPSFSGFVAPTAEELEETLIRGTKQRATAVDLSKPKRGKSKR
ncbi:hypothetical protein BT96DRAFT_841566 [Gymnopus androsaceus JB14]|uniref:Uncharacterized protein n=1 Tax=Gymnopus androsaceus JB14 TaxID=1447944 RepID=A0A6A4GHP6_9AGAR|nr:hypothetical protein BT96DRAFT_841566 [Gymnopus androsaceus JB14]